MFAAVVLVAATTSATIAEAARPAATMHDLQGHFAACFHPPKEAADTRVTFYFSLNDRGQVVAAPRTVWFGFKGEESERAREISSFDAAFTSCLPLAMSPALAASIPGKVYFLQYVVGAGGDTREVLLRPFGSHGGGLQPPPNLEPEPFEPRPAGVAPLRILRPAPFTTRPYAPLHPPYGRFRLFSRAWHVGPAARPAPVRGR